MTHVGFREIWALLSVSISHHCQARRAARGWGHFKRFGGWRLAIQTRPQKMLCTAPQRNPDYSVMPFSFSACNVKWIKWNYKEVQDKVGKKGEEMAQRRRVKSRGQDWTSWEVWSRQLQRKDPKGWRRLWQALNLCRLSCSTTVSQYGWAWKYRSYQYRSMATEKRDKDAQRERKLTENTTS